MTLRQFGLRLGIGAAFLAMACAPRHPRVRPVEPGAANSVARVPRAPVVVIVVVDQFAAWIAEERLGALPADGGFARLRREGWYAPTLRYEHATTSTAPGHAALFTGLPPRESGIFTNERFDARGQVVSILADPTKRVVLERIQPDAGSSAENLLAPTLADALREQRPEALIMALSLKDRGAIFGGGRGPNVSAWFDRSRGQFVTSNAFATSLPAWLLQMNAELASRLPSIRWEPLDPAWIAQHAKTPDAAPGEGDLGLGSVFPYDLARAAKPASVFRATPAADEFLVALGLRALDAGSATDGPRLLVLSLSTFDYIGHTFGPDSWESWDALRRLDVLLAHLQSELDRRFHGQYALLLSADHGSVVLPETAGVAGARPWCDSGELDLFERPCDKGGRLYRDELERLMNDAARKVLGPGAWIAGVSEPFVYFTPEARALEATRRGALTEALVSALLKKPEIARVFVKDRFSGPCPVGPEGSLEALVCRSLSEDAGDLYIVTKPGSFFDAELARGRGINHGTPYLYDRTVPLFVRTPAREHAGETVTTPLRPQDFTRTAASLLGVSPPRGAKEGRDVNRCDDCFSRD